jgi:tetratricopeptide (TPR) repeat protein
VRQSQTATGTYRDGKSVHGKWHIYPEMAAAGLWTTPTDLAKFAIEISQEKQGKSSKVLSQKMIEEMFTRPPASTDFGIGIALPANNPGEFGHDGADEGFQAELIMNADTGQGVAIMANSDNGILVAREYIRSLAKEYGWKNQPSARGTGEELMLIAALKGPDAAVARLEDLEKTSGKKPDEGLLNMLGYVMLSQGKTDVAIKLFQKNVDAYPESSNVYDSLGEAYAAAGKKELAIANYEKSLQLDPKNMNAVEWLKKLKSAQ